MRGGLILVIIVIICSNLLIVTQAQQQCPNAPASPQDRRVDKTKLTIATYNVEWLFLNRSNCPGTYFFFFCCLQSSSIHFQLRIFPISISQRLFLFYFILFLLNVSF